MLCTTPLVGDNFSKLVKLAWPKIHDFADFGLFRPEKPKAGTE